MGELRQNSYEEHLEDLRAELDTNGLKGAIQGYLDLIIGESNEVDSYRNGR